MDKFKIHIGLQNEVSVYEELYISNWTENAIGKDTTGEVANSIMDLLASSWQVKDYFACIKLV